MEAKPIGHRINQRGNEIRGDKRKLIHNDWKSTGHIKSGFKIEVYSKKRAYLRKQENYKINNLNLCLNQLEEEQKTRRKEIIKIRIEIKEVETKNNRKGNRAQINKSEMRKKLLLTCQKYKELLENTTKNYMPIKLTA